MLGKDLPIKAVADDVHSGDDDGVYDDSEGEVEDSKEPKELIGSVNKRRGRKPKSYGPSNVDTDVIIPVAIAQKMNRHPLPAPNMIGKVRDIVMLHTLCN